MSKTISKAAYDAAKAKADAGDVLGAWQALADAGDNYARAGAAIMDPNGVSFIKSVVEKTWELEVGLDVYNAKFAKVASYHLSGYLAVIEESIDNQNGAILPTTVEIENSYKKALDRHGVSHNASIDAIINRIGDFGLHWARLMDAFDGYWSNVYDIDASRIKSDHAIYSEHSQFNAAIALTQIAAAAAADRSGPEADFLDDPFAGITPGDGDSDGGDGNGPPPGNPNAESVVGDSFGQILSAFAKTKLTSTVAKAFGIPAVVVSVVVGLVSNLFKSDSGADGPSPETDPALGDGWVSPGGSTAPVGGPNNNPHKHPGNEGGDSSTSPGTDRPSGGGWASQGGNTAPVGGPSNNPGNHPGRNSDRNGNNGDGPGGGDYGGNDADGGYGDYGGLPIVLDLDGDGVELVSLDESAAFYDINGNSYLYNTGWAGRDDALLAYDKDGDNDITAHDEISFVDYKAGARTDWEGLAHFDSNNDGVLDSRDTEFAKFRVWQDADGDGDVDAGELKTLAQRGIRSLDLNPNYGATLSPTDRDGNLIYGQGGYTKTDGTRGVFGDVALATSAMGYRINNGELEFKTANGEGKVYIAPANAGAVNMNFASAVHVAHIGAIGGGGDDVLNGAGVARDLLLFGDDGDDRLTGGSGDDWLAGGAGADTLRGGAGHDVLFFDASDDVHGGDGQDIGVVSGSNNIDLSMGAVGLEVLHSGDGNDRLSGFDSAQGIIIDGGGGDDTMRGSHQRDVLSGGDGDDYIKGHKGEDVVLGGTGNDRLEGNRGNDLVYGGEGDDRLYGLIDDDQLFGGAGNDDLDGGYGDDRLEGGTGRDTYLFTHDDFGSDTIRDSGGSSDVIDMRGRRYENVWLSRQGDDLRISVLGTEDEVLVDGQFANSESRVELLWASDYWGAASGGVTVSDGPSITPVWNEGPYLVGIDALVNAMATFDKPQTGWSGMSNQERANVDAAWGALGVGHGASTVAVTVSIASVTLAS